MIEDLLIKYEEHEKDIFDSKSMVDLYKLKLNKSKKNLKQLQTQIEDHINSEFNKYLLKKNIFDQIKTKFNGKSVSIYIGNKSNNTVTEKYSDFVNNYNLKIDIFN